VWGWSVWVIVVVWVPTGSFSKIAASLSKPSDYAG